MYLCMMSVCPQLTVLSLPRPGSSVLHSCHRLACQSHWVLALGKHAHMSDICGLCLQASESHLVMSCAWHATQTLFWSQAPHVSSGFKLRHGM